MLARVLIPVKAFAVAKVRLADALSAAERADLARTMAERVVAAAAPLPVAVACDDPDVAAWAEALGASVVWTPGRGLNGAVQQGVIELFEVGAEIVIVAHGDLPHATGLARLADFDGVTLVPDRRDDGTNVAAIAASAAAFTFSYGVGSFTRHVAEATRINACLRVARIPELQWDVDTPDDLREPIVT